MAVSCMLSFCCFVYPFGEMLEADHLWSYGIQNLKRFLKAKKRRIHKADLHVSK